MQRVNLLNIQINNVRLRDALAEINEGVIVTPNVDHLVKTQRDREFYEIYQMADYVLCDSKLVQAASGFMGTPIIEKISGSDFFPAFYSYHKDNPDVRIFLLGAKPGVAKSAAEIINAKIGRDIVVDTYSPPIGFENDDKECATILDRINGTNATVLAVGLGTPKGEKWIAAHKAALPGVKLFMSIGATIDFEAGNIKRAPKWVSDSGLEWLYRLVREPGRLWKRYLLDDLPFFWLIFKQKIGLYSDPFAKESVANE